MFNWAQQTFDKLSQTVAPPPTDGAGRFAYAVQSNDEASAMGCLAEIDAFTTIVNQSKGLYPMHMACSSSMIQLVRMMMNQPGANLDATDGAGNTPMHHAAMSTKANALELCKILISEYGASAMVKNYAGQTPYDVATVSTVRQYLLPIQLQAETQHAIDNGGMGLPPGIDMGGLRIKNSAMPPPPSQFGAGPPSASAPAPPPPMGFGQPHGHPTIASSPVPAASGGPNMFGTPSPAEPNRSNTSPAVAPAPASMPAHLEQAPTSGNREYARVGSSSAAIFSKPKDGTRTYVRPDGFHSSSSDVSLQKKYGHQPVGGHQSAVPPPPSSGGGPLPAAPMSAGANPFAAGSSLGGGSRYGSLPPTNRRYVAYGPTATAPAPATSQPAYNYHAPAPMTAPGVTMFTPGAASQQQQQAPAPYTPQASITSPQGYQQGAPTAHHSQVPQAQPQQTYQQQQPSPSNSFMPPPPYQTESYQTQNYQSQQQQFPPETAATPSTPAHATAYTPSPSGATYGSAVTPGTALETPGAFGMNPSSGATPVTEAKELFSSPPAATTSYAAPSVSYTSPAANANISSPTQQAPSSFHSQPTPAYAQQPTQQDPVESASSSAQAPFGAKPEPTPVTATAQPSSIPHTKSAEELFGECPPVEQPGHHQVDALKSEPTVQSPETAELPERARTMSADELFAAPAPSPQQPTSETSAADSQAGINQPSLNMDTSSPQRQVFANDGVASEVFVSGGNAGSGSAEQVFGAGAGQSGGFAHLSSKPNTDMSGGQPSTSQVQAPSANVNASDFFGGASSGTAGSGSAEQVFGAAPAQDLTPQQPTSQDYAQVIREETTADLDGESEELMTEVPLSPGVPGSAKRGNLQSEATVPQPAQGAAPPAGESLFAAIGLPPPPMSSRR